MTRGRPFRSVPPAVTRRPPRAGVDAPRGPAHQRRPTSRLDSTRAPRSTGVHASAGAAGRRRQRPVEVENLHVTEVRSGFDGTRRICQAAAVRRELRHAVHDRFLGLGQPANDLTLGRQENDAWLTPGVGATRRHEAAVARPREGVHRQGAQVSRRALGRTTLESVGRAASCRCEEAPSVWRSRGGRTVAVRRPHGYNPRSSIRNHPTRAAAQFLLASVPRPSWIGSPVFRTRRSCVGFRTGPPARRCLTGGRSLRTGLTATKRRPRCFP